MVKTKLPAETNVACVVLLLAVLGVVNVYRGWTQSITYDEAVTYDAFVVGPMSHAFTGYNANNHVLFTILAKVTTGAIGATEFGLRFPSIVAGVVYFAVVFFLCRLLFGRGALFSMAAAALALNPIVLDFLSAARGYGVALALFMVAFHQVAVMLVRSSSDGTAGRRRWLVVSLALAGSVSSNLAFLFPAVGLGLVALTLAAFDAFGPGRVSVRHFGRTTVLPLCGPGLVMTTALLAVPLSRAEREHFTYGASRLADTVTSLVDLSVRHHPSGWSIDTLTAMVGRVEATVLVPLTLIALLTTAGILATRALRARSLSALTSEDRFLLLLTGTLYVTLAQLFAVHRLWDVPYPLDRTGLYFVPMFILALALLAQRAAVWSRGSTAVRGFSLILLGILVSQFVAQFNVTQYGMWRFDAGTRTLYDITARWPEPDRDTPFRIAASWLLRPSLEYYRRADATSRMVAVSDGLAGIQPDEFDFAVVSDWVWGDVDSLRDVARLVCVHPVSGAMLFVNRAGGAARGLESVRSGSSPRADCERVRARLIHEPPLKDERPGLVAIGRRLSGAFANLGFGQRKSDSSYRTFWVFSGLSS